MGLYRHLVELNRNGSDEWRKFHRERLIQWRKEPAIFRIEHPTNLVSARRLGYKAKSGFVVVRVRLKRCGKFRPSIRHGRRSAHMRQRLVMSKNYQRIAEERANKEFVNLEVLNSYKVGKDGTHYWFEIIMIDPYNPVVATDTNVGWVSSGKHRGRAYRGLTSAGRRGRGLRHKGQGAEKLRPSLRAHKKLGK